MEWNSMREFTTPSFPIYMYDGEGGYKVMTMGEVFSFPLALLGQSIELLMVLASSGIIWA